VSYFFRFILISVLLQPVVASSATAFTITDDLDNQLKFDQPVKSLVALSPHLAELVFEAGADEKLLATVDYADFPQAAKTIPRVGSYNAWDYEKIVALKPDVILVWLSGSGHASVEKLRQLGLKVYVSEPVALTDISKTIRDIGKMAATGKIAENNAYHFEQAIKYLSSQYAKKQKVRYFYQVWSEPLISINGRQLISRVFELCGGENVFAHVPVLAPVISLEALLLANPDVMVGGAGETDKGMWLVQWKKWSVLNAVKQNNLFFIDPDLLGRQTSRMLQGAKQVCLMLEQAREGK